MLKTLVTASLALGALAHSVPAAYAQTVKVMVMQTDRDTSSLKRNSRIQNAVLNAFNQGLNAPATADTLRKFGVDGLDVYNEVSLTLKFDKQGRTRRSEQELISILQDIRNPRLDIVVFYTLYARAVDDKYRSYSSLQMAMNYRAIDIRSGRYLGGDNLDIDTRGVPFTGCAAGPNADRHCVREFVSSYAERLVRDAASVLATQISSLVAGGGKRASASIKDDSYPAGIRPSGASGDEEYEDKKFAERPKGRCRELPRQYKVTFKGVSKRDIHYITRRMHEWPCRIDIGLVDSSPSQASYTYKVRANEALLKRSLELTMEFIGIEGNVNTRDVNELIISGIPLRRN